MCKSGVYWIRNKTDNKIYIGSTKKLRHRELEHLSMLRRGCHHSPHLQHAWDKYGEANFEFTILITCHPTMCLWYEQQFLDQWGPDYNLCPNATSRLDYIMPDDIRHKISQGKQGHGVSQETRQRISHGLQRAWSRGDYDKRRSTVTTAHHSQAFRDKMKEISLSRKRDRYGRYT